MIQTKAPTIVHLMKQALIHVEFCNKEEELRTHHCAERSCWRPRRDSASNSARRVPSRATVDDRAAPSYLASPILTVES